MTLRQDETDVNFLDIKPADLEHAAEVLRGELSANRRAWEKTHWASEYVKENYPQDVRVLADLDTIRHHVDRRV